MMGAAPLVVCVAGARAICTVIGAVMTWLTIWHFASTPFPLFYGWLINLIALTICSSIAVTQAGGTAQILFYLWSSASGRLSTNSSGPLDSIVQKAGHISGPQIPSGSRQPCQSRRSAWSLSTHLAHGVSAIIECILAAVIILVLLAVIMFFHGGAVIADIRVILAWIKHNNAANTAAQQKLHSELQTARLAAAQASVLLALLFVVPSVSIKWSLMIINMDFSTIPVTSTALSTVSSIAVLSTFFANTYIHCRVWSFGQRIVGVTCVIMTVSGLFLSRLAAFCWLILKFGGEVEPIWMWLCHFTLLVNVFARSAARRQQFLECYLSDKLVTLFITVTGASVLSFDIPSLHQGLKSQQLHRKPTWLLQVFTSTSSLTLITWRMLEALVSYIIITTLNPLPACTVDPDHFSSLYGMCAAVANERSLWRPRCWGCSIFDFVAGTSCHAKTLLLVLMWGAAGITFMVAGLGLCGTWCLCRGYVSRQQQGLPVVAVQTSVSRGSGAVTSSTNSSGPLMPSLVSVTAAPDTLAAGPAADTSNFVTAVALKSLGCPVDICSVQGNTGCNESLCEQQGSKNGWCVSTSVGGNDSIDAQVDQSHAASIQLQHPAIATPGRIPPGVAGTDDTCGPRKGLPLRLELVLLIAMCVLADLVLFNCHWYIQVAMLPVGVLYLVWLQLSYSCCAGRGVTVTALNALLPQRS